MARIIVDPITRIEGHLRIEVEVDENKVIRDAWASIGLWRGIETILKGRDPRDAPLMVQRFCGVCTYSHYEASTMAVEDAFKVRPPKNARLIRNLINAAHFVTDHVMHFYHLHGLDWVDIVSALSADPHKAVKLATDFGATFNSSAAQYQRVQERLGGFVKSGRLGPFANAYWGNPAYKLSPEANLVIASHYLDALQVAKLSSQMMAIFGGKSPHPQSLVVGGVSCVMDALEAERIGQYRYRLKELKTFIDTAYLPDVAIAASFYKDEGLEGVGAGVSNYLSYGGFALDDDRIATLLPKGVIRDRNLARVEDLDENKISEEATHAWYRDAKPRHPYEGATEPDYTGFDSTGHLKGDGKYSWCKAPRYDGLPFEVGPLARCIVGYAQGDKLFKPLIDEFLSRHQLPATVLFSTLGRTAARALETKLIADQADLWVEELIQNIRFGDNLTWTRCKLPEAEAQGRCLTEVPRGALGHWLRIADGVIVNYQAVVPSTWDCSPRDAAGQRGPYEQALVGTRLANIEQPLEILRTIHSFDPCMACAVHIIDPRTREVRKFKVA